ncbi:peroxisomal membrane protein 11C-like [Mya arenaria]|uniref:peroxisomal membrane protein 11C-like n=1 Tax=Mya arenaria TaxID=6604 RepID=UPI0022E60F26|nr:peroxisomal membrane protein 11C-like [Mya arenaria]
MDTAVRLVGSYTSRDKFIRLCQYILKFLAGQQKTNAGIRLGVISSELGACRTVLRLFDDVPMFAYSLSYGLGRKEKNTWLRCLQLLGNLANQVYYPLEHIAWLADRKILERNSGPWGLACLVAWAVSLLTEIFKSILQIRLIRRAQIQLLKERELEAQEERETAEMSTSLKGQIKVLKSQERELYLAVIEHLTDLVNAINWLPPGFLWSGKFSARFTGAMGTISSAIKLYRFHKRTDSS